jgi:ubiquinone/menaquinone biosynthesis C-methylase UbiE
MKYPDYSQITESPGLYATQEQLERIYQRYHFAKQFCQGKEVVEVACGSGMGLGYLASFSKSVLGGDIDDKNLLTARELYKSIPEVTIEKMDAHYLPLPDNSYDTVLLFEAVYYLKHPEKFISESQRVLRTRGHLIICTVNREWRDFHPSPYTHEYLSAAELRKMLNEKFNDIKIYGGFKIKTGTRATVFSLLKRAAVRMDLIPVSLKLRAYLKNIFIGKTFPLPATVSEGMTAYSVPKEIMDYEDSSEYKILYAVAVK